MFQAHARRGLLNAISSVLLVIACKPKTKIFPAAQLLFYVLRKVCITLTKSAYFTKTYHYELFQDKKANGSPTLGSSE